MDIAKDLALIDGLRTRAVPAEPGADPYHRAVLGLRAWESAQDCYAYEDAVAERLTERWGEPSRWGTTTLVERAARGEHIPEPWAMLSTWATDLRTWEADDRWITLTAIDGDSEELPQVYVVVTREAPP
ncbi:hypothetical protein Stsp02_55850 [Streptomyces sp. NBRC 14336]|uniref:hypothetical protein n=1 Tax=Streptomyces sp. NBRC 14336 TaxID=3030992 RepID=UPI0024A2B738|nr:hypothetical protein [Streptomyces sp. NBRC 14336]WBO76611.1 hypothetical protein SBE_000061 [Streptomyces sp. SBE_14.2]GLW49924.1 hypothetical protein Stsp02_55850 [Streptomyces sp. NBRC 14336]